MHICQADTPLRLFYVPSNALNLTYPAIRRFLHLTTPHVPLLTVLPRVPSTVGNPERKRNKKRTTTVAEGDGKKEYSLP